MAKTKLLFFAVACLFAATTNQLRLLDLTETPDDAESKPEADA